MVHRRHTARSLTWLLAADVPVLVSPVLENAYRPDVERIIEVARRIAIA